MTYNLAIEYINSIIGVREKSGLKTMSCLMARLDNPQDKLKFIHVAGTNGKGSTCAMIASILQTCGYSVGLYTSPHLSVYNDRIRVNGSFISDEDFARQAGIVKDAGDIIVGEGENQPRIFEFLTAMAFNYFFEKKVDYVILEVGIGGRLDATNVIKNPLLSVITSISFDHTEYLGNTLEQIAYEKSGIIKENCITVLYYQCNDVYNIVNEVCKKRNSKLYYPKFQNVTVIEQNLKNTIFSVETDLFCYNNIIIKMLGEYQIHNACNTLMCVEALKSLGITITEECVLNGLENSLWYGRMEIINNNPLIILDGAHNSGGIAMLKSSIKKYFGDKKITLLVGIFKDKDYINMIGSLMDVCNKVIVTQPESERALQALQLFDNIKKYDKVVYIEKNLPKAIKLLRKITNADDIVFCAGSLYLVGEIRDCFEDSWNE